MSDLYKKGEQERAQAVIEWYKKIEALKSTTRKCLPRLTKCGKIVNV